MNSDVNSDIGFDSPDRPARFVNHSDRRVGARGKARLGGGPLPHQTAVHEGRGGWEARGGGGGGGSGALASRSCRNESDADLSIGSSSATGVATLAGFQLKGVPKEQIGLLLEQQAERRAARAKGGGGSGDVGAAAAGALGAVAGGGGGMRKGRMGGSAGENDMQGYYAQRDSGQQQQHHQQQQQHRRKYYCGPETSSAPGFSLTSVGAPSALLFPHQHQQHQQQHQQHQQLHQQQQQQHHQQQQQQQEAEHQHGTKTGGAKAAGAAAGATSNAAGTGATSAATTAAAPGPSSRPGGGIGPLQGRAIGVSSLKDHHRGTYPSLRPTDYIFEKPYEDLRTRYILHNKKLGSGQYGVIRRCLEISSGMQLACKTVKKAEIKSHEEAQDLKKEVATLSMLQGHPFIVRLHDTVEDRK
ncbi:unnamed protein product, partial [Closterium sp. NIES-54]